MEIAEAHPPEIAAPATAADSTQALEANGRPVRIAQHHRCGARLFTGYHGFNHIHWLTRYYASREPEAPGLKHCPQCQGALDALSVSVYFDEPEAAAPTPLAHQLSGLERHGCERAPHSSSQP